MLENPSRPSRESTESSADTDPVPDVPHPDSPTPTKRRSLSLHTTPRKPVDLSLDDCVCVLVPDLVGIETCFSRGCWERCRRHKGQDANTEEFFTDSEGHFSHKYQ